MTDLWRLPETVRLGDRQQPINTDFRNILRIIGYLNDSSLPEIFRWRIALKLFYGEELLQPDAMEAMCRFIAGGEEAQGAGHKLLDWQRDADLIVADVNRVAGTEIRALAHVHWWTFLAWFHGIGDGQLCTLVSIRDKLRRGKKLEGWEKDYFRQNKDRVLLRPALSPGEQAQKQALEEILRRRV